MSFEYAILSVVLDQCKSSYPTLHYTEVSPNDPKFCIGDKEFPDRFMSYRAFSRMRICHQISIIEDELLIMCTKHRYAQKGSSVSISITDPDFIELAMCEVEKVYAIYELLRA